MLNLVGGRIRLYLVAWLVLIALAFYPFTWASETFGQEVPRWLRQLVSSALVMGSRPMVSAVRHRSGHAPEQVAAGPNSAQASLESCAETGRHSPRQHLFLVPTCE